MPFSYVGKKKTHKINYTLYLDLTKKFCEFGFIIFCFQIRKLRLGKGQWFEPVSSLTPELCALPCPPYGARLSALRQWDLAGVFHVTLNCKLYELVCVFFLSSFPPKFLASQPGIEKLVAF